MPFFCLLNPFQIITFGRDLKTIHIANPSILSSIRLMKKLLFFLTAAITAMSLWAQKPASIDDINQFVSWDMGAMSVYLEGEIVVIQDAKNSLVLCLEPIGDGVYQEITEDREMIGQGARFVAEKVGDVTTLTAYSDKMMLFSLISCDDVEAYRNRAYLRILKSRFEPTDGGPITITDDTMSGPILPDCPEIDYFFVEDGNGDLTNIMRLSPGRFHLAFAPADKGINLHYCDINPQTGDIEVNHERENTIILRYAQDPDWPWLSTDVLDTGFIIYNFEKPYWQVMLNKLNAKKQLNDVEKWNRKLIENLLQYNDPYTGIESTDY